jgi:hypothetical protein
MSSASLTAERHVLQGTILVPIPENQRNLHEAALASPAKEAS